MVIRLFLLLCLTAALWADPEPARLEFDSPQELLRAARDLRLDLSDLGPTQFRGGSNFSNGFDRGDMSKLSLAVSYFERACMRVEDPRETLAAFLDLEKAYQRAWRPGPYGSASVRDFEKIMARLERFYASLDSPTQPETPTP